MDRIAAAVAQLVGGISVLACVVYGVVHAIAILLWTARGVRRGMVEAEVDYRAAHGRCLGCGYRLAGNTSGVCPECGRPRSGTPATPAGSRGPT